MAATQLCPVPFSYVCAIYYWAQLSAGHQNMYFLEENYLLSAHLHGFIHPYSSMICAYVLRAYSREKLNMLEELTLYRIRLVHTEY